MILEMVAGLRSQWLHSYIMYSVNVRSGTSSLHHALALDLGLELVYLRFDGVFQFWKTETVYLKFKNYPKLQYFMRNTK